MAGFPTLQGGFVSPMRAALDLTTPAGRAFAGFLAVFAEFERDLIRERIKAGITDARKRGKAHGRPRATANDAAQIRTLAQQGLIIDVAIMVWESGAYFGSGELPTATGTRHRRSTPYQAYRTKDGYVTVGGNNNKLWTAFCTAVCGKPEWLVANSNGDHSGQVRQDRHAGGVLAVGATHASPLSISLRIRAALSDG